MYVPFANIISRFDADDVVNLDFDGRMGAIETFAKWCRVGLWAGAGKVVWGSYRL